MNKVWYVLEVLTARTPLNRPGSGLSLSRPFFEISCVLQLFLNTSAKRECRERAARAGASAQREQRSRDERAARAARYWTSAQRDQPVMASAQRCGNDPPQVHNGTRATVRYSLYCIVYNSQVVPSSKKTYTNKFTDQTRIYIFRKEHIRCIMKENTAEY